MWISTKLNVVQVAEVRLTATDASGNPRQTNDRDEADDCVGRDSCADEDSSRGCSVVQQPSQLLARCQTIIRCEDFFTNGVFPHLMLSRRGLRRGN